MQIEFIKAQPSDKAFLLTLRKLTMTEHLESSGLFLTDTEHKERMEHDFAHAFLIALPEQDKRIAGATQFIQKDSYLELLQLQIHPDFQNLGIGSAVINQLKTIARQNGKGIRLTVLKTNPAKVLYERHGFKEIGEDKFEYSMHYQD